MIATEPATTRQRPLVVTLAVVLVYLVAIPAIVVGVLVLLTRYETPDPGERLAISLFGIGIVLFGLLGLSVASGLARGSRLSQLLITVFTGIELTLQVAGVLIDQRFGVGSAISIALSVALIVVLWLPTSRRYFRAAVPADA